MRKIKLTLKFLDIHVRLKISYFVILTLVFILPANIFIYHYLITPEEVRAADACVWSNGNGNGLASTAANWSSCSSAIPSGLDTATLTSVGGVDVTWDYAGTFTITLDATFTNTVTQTANITGTFFVTVNGGTWNTNGKVIITNGGMSIGTGGNFINTTGGIWFNGTFAGGLTDNSTGGINFGNVLMTSTTNKTAVTNVTIKSLNIQTGTSFTIAANKKMTLTGSSAVLTITGTLVASSGSTVEFQCSADCTSDGDSGDPFKDVILNNPSSNTKVTMTQQWDINGNLTLTKGILDRGTACGAFGCNITISGNWTVTGGSSAGCLCNTTFDGSSAQSVTATSSTAIGQTLIQNTVNVQAGSDFSISRLQINSGGTLNLNGNPMSVLGDYTIDSGGIINASNATTTIINFVTSGINDSTGRQNLGNIVIQGNQPLETNIQVNNLTVGTSTTATILDLASFTLDVDGTLILDGNLDLGTGNLTIGSNLLVQTGGNWDRGSGVVTFDGDGTLTATTTNNFDLGDILIASTTAATTLTLGSSATSSYVYVLDTFNIGNNHLHLITTTTKATTTPFVVDGTFSKGGSSVVSYENTTAATVDNTTYDNLVINGSGVTFTAGGVVDVDNALTITAGTLAMSNNNLNVGGNYTNSDTYTPGTNTTAFDATSGTKTITIGNKSAFSSVTFNGSGAIFALQDQLNASSTLTITAGTLSANNQSMLLNGALIIGASGVFTKGTATTTFAGSASFTDSSSGQDMGNVVVGGSGNTLTLASAIITDNMTINSGTSLAGASKNLTVSGHYLNNGTYTPGTNVTTFDAGSETKRITSGNASGFSSVTFNDGGGTGSFELQDQLNASSTLRITAGALLANGKTIEVDGNWFNEDTYTHANNTVLFTGTSQTINGTTTFYDLTKIITTADTLTFENGNTQTIVGTTTLQGASGQLLSLRSAVSGSIWTIDPQSTRTISFVDVKDSTNSNASVIDCTASNCTDSGTNTNWDFIVASPAPTGTSGGGGGFFKKPPIQGLIFINDNKPYTNSRTLILTLLSEDATEMAVGDTQDLSGYSFEPYQATKQWKISQGDSVKTMYAKFRDAQGGESEIVSDSIILDTKTPNNPSILVPTQDEKRINPELIVVGTAEPNTKLLLTLDSLTTVTVTVSTSGTWSYLFPLSLKVGRHTAVAQSEDLAGNKSSIETVNFSIISLVVLPPPPIRIPLPTSTPPIILPPIVTPTSTPTTTIPISTPTTTPIIPPSETYITFTLIEDIIGILKELSKNTYDTVATLITPISNHINQPPRPNLTPIRNLATILNRFAYEPTRDVIAQINIRPITNGLAYISTILLDTMRNSSLTIYDTIALVTQPIGPTLTNLPIPYIDLSPVQRLASVVTSTVINASRIASLTTYDTLAKLIAPISNRIAQPPRPNIKPIQTALKPLRDTYQDVSDSLALVYLRRLETIERKLIALNSITYVPSKVEETQAPALAQKDFAMITSYGNLDVTPAINEKALLPPGKQITLYFKPEREVNNITLTTLYNTSISIKPYEFKYLFIRSAKAASFAEAREYIIDEGLYRDTDGDGIWEVTITLPVVGGNYAFETVVDYIVGEDDIITRQFLIDPEGYVFRKAGDDEARLSEVIVTLYEFDKQTGLYHIWDAGRYDQLNPQITHTTGEYSFLVPQGTYYLTTLKDGYTLFESEPVFIERTSPLHLNIELKKEGFFKNLFY